MSTKTALRLGARRLLFLFLLSLLLVAAGSEGAYIFQKEAYDRAPQVVELVVPAGAAEQIAAGRPVPAIPDELIFVVGDLLVVRNEDVVDHQLGPLWIPAGASASLVMEQAEELAYSCSFQSSRYLGLDIKQPTTWRTRLVALILAAPATTVFIFLYSLVIWPLQPRRRPAIPASGQPSPETSSKI
jgi:hypothetical protein